MAIRLNIVSQFDNRGIKAAQREIAAVGRNISRSLDVAMIGGLTAAATGIVSAVKAASNYAAEFEGVNQVFKSAAGSVQEFAKQAAATAGLTSTEALQASKVFGLFASSAGLSGQAAADFSTKMVQLAGDLGSFNDVPTADALAAIQSGLQGEAEPLRRFGVFLTDNALKAEYFAQTGQKVTGSLSAQQKMMASYYLILKQTSIQQGDYVKYSDTMGNSIKTTVAEFKNLTAEIGAQLVPVIEELMPAVQALIPEIGAKMKAAVSSVDWKGLFTTLIDGLSFLIANIEPISRFTAGIWVMTKAFAAVEIAVKLASVAFGILNGTLALNPIGAVVVLLGGLALGMIAVADAANKAALDTGELKTQWTGLKEELKSDPWKQVTKSTLGYGIALEGIIEKQSRIATAPISKRGIAGEMARYGALEAAGSALGLGAKSAIQDPFKGVDFGASSPKTKKKITDYVKDFYGNVSDELKKQSAKSQLISMGASEGLISSILGSAGWQKVWLDIKKKGVPALRDLQTQFSKTADGIQETSDYLAKITALDDKFAEDSKRATQEITDKYQGLIDDNIRSLEEFTKLGKQTLADLTKSLEVYGKIGKSVDMGAFESEVVSAFDSVQEGLKNALANKTITQDAYNNLLAYATRENALLQKIGKQRDQIAAKRSLVEALMGDVKTAFMGFANINSQVQATSQTITETTSKVVNGLVVETRRTYEQTNAATSVADNFRTMVEKARSFVALLKTLKSQGLNAELFKQIVDAGVEAGTATAEGILAGGPDAITEINSLFADLQTISADAAETTAVVMYNGGQDVAGGFLNGLKAEESALAEAAAMMATTFSQTFETALVAAITAALEAAQAASKAAITALMTQMQAELASAIAALQAEYDRQRALLGNAPGAGLTGNAAAVAALQEKISNATGYIVNIDSNAKETGAAAKLGTYVTDLTNMTGNFVETSRSIAEIEQSIANASKYIANINNDVKEAGATNKLIGYYAELASANAQASSTNNTIIVKAGVITSGASVGQAITSELNKYASVSG